MAHSPSYVPPDRKRVAGLLPEFYESYRKLVRALLDGASHLNVIVDASFDFRGDRLLNITAYVPGGVAFHWQTVNLGTELRTSKETFASLLPAFRELSGEYPKRLNFISTDADSARDLYEEMKDGQFSHSFSSVCSSEGLQLLVKEITESDPWKSLFYQIASIIAFFRRSKEQLDHLRSHQLSEYGKVHAFTTSGLTRQGTQYRALQSIVRDKRALKKWARDSAVRQAISKTFARTDCSAKSIQLLLQNTLAAIKSYDFWDRLEAADEVLEPIHKFQMKFETDRAHIGHVLPAYKAISASWEQLKESEQYPHVDFEKLSSALASCREKHASDIHYAAYALDPVNLKTALSADEEHRALRFLKEVTASEDWPSVSENFDHFRSQTGFFEPNAKQIYAQPHLAAFDYWIFFSACGDKLGAIGVRLFHFISSSMPSERLYSENDFLHVRTRNGLPLRDSEKLAFIYLNHRALKRWEQYEKGRKEDPKSWKSGPAAGPTWDTAEDEELLDLEDAFFLGLFERTGPIEELLESADAYKYQEKQLQLLDIGNCETGREEDNLALVCT